MQWLNLSPYYYNIVEPLSAKGSFKIVYRTNLFLLQQKKYFKKNLGQKWLQHVLTHIDLNLPFPLTKFLESYILKIYFCPIFVFLTLWKTIKDYFQKDKVWNPGFFWALDLTSGSRGWCNEEVPGNLRLIFEKSWYTLKKS